jgi:hypothetical protein
MIGDKPVPNVAESTLSHFRIQMRSIRRQIENAGMRGIVCLSLLLVAASVVAAAPSSEATQVAGRVLLSRGLTPSANIWISRREATVKRNVEALEGLERRHQLAIAKADEMLAANEAIRARLVQAEEAARTKGRPDGNRPHPSSSRQSGRTAPTTPTELTSQMPDVTGLGEQSPLQLAMIELSNSRVALQLAILHILRETPKLEAEYKALESDVDVQSALKVIPASPRLGPAANYQREVVRTESAKAAAFKSEIPGYFESGRFRLLAIVNEIQPVTFSLSDNGPSVLTASVAQQLGLPGRIAPRMQELDLEGRHVSVYPVRLTELRLGSVAFKNVAAIVLPPDAEDLGSRLSVASLTGYRATIQPRQMKLLLAPVAPK